MSEEFAMTDQSKSLGKLFTALTVVQGQLTGAIKSKENPFFKSHYADLEAVWDSCRQLLSENGMCVIQTNGGTVDYPSVITMLGHISGEWIRGELPIRPDKKGPQGAGSAITYARRYGLCAIVGICPLDKSSDEDDDAESATDHGKNDEPVKKEPDNDGPVDFKKLSKTQPQDTDGAGDKGWIFTDKPVPKEYWDSRDQSLIGGKGHSVRKNDAGVYVIVKRDDVPF